MRLVLISLFSGLAAGSLVFGSLVWALRPALTPCPSAPAVVAQARQSVLLSEVMANMDADATRGLMAAIRKTEEARIR